MVLDVGGSSENEILQSVIQMASNLVLGQAILGFWKFVISEFQTMNTVKFSFYTLLVITCILRVSCP